MVLQNSGNRYGSLSIALHWLVVILIIAVYTMIELREFYPKGSEMREALKTWHFTLGLTVFAVTSFRLGWRFTQTVPAITPPPARWQQMSARVLHGMLYVLLLCAPIAGWLILSAEGKNIPFWGLELPPLIAENETTAELIEDAHNLAGKIGYALIGLHATAALLHHYYFRDDTLKRILPER